MDVAAFQQLRHEMMRLRKDQQYTQAFQLLGEQAGRFPQEAMRLYNWRMCLSALSGDQMQAIQIFGMAVEHGFWWSEAYLRGDPDLASLQGLPDFERLVGICEERHLRAHQEAQPELLIREPSTGEAPYPLLIGLHSHGGNAAITLPSWEPLLDQGWLVAIPQSTQVIAHQCYAWDDYKRAMAELKAHYDFLCEHYSIDQQRVLLGGFSQGGSLAIWMAGQATPLARRFLIVAPWFHNLQELDERGTHTAPGTRGYLVFGRQDPLWETFPKIEGLLSKWGIPYSKEEHPGLGHEFPPEFAATLEQAISWLFAE